MAITNFTANVSVHQSMEDEPNDVGGLTAAGEDNSAVMTPLRTAEAIAKISAPKLLTAYDVSGTYTFTVPDGVSAVGVVVAGGGGGGNSGYYGYSNGAGGGGGYIEHISRLSVTPGQTIPLVVGPGGAGGAAPPSSNPQYTFGADGGTSSFAEITAYGGKGANAYSGGLGGANGGRGCTSTAADGASTEGKSSGGSLQQATGALDPFTGARYGAGGGGGGYALAGFTAGKAGGSSDLGNGGAGGTASAVPGMGSAGGNGAKCCCGGGGGGYEIKAGAGGNGGDGMVLIYRVV